MLKPHLISPLFPPCSPLIPFLLHFSFFCKFEAHKKIWGGPQHPPPCMATMAKSLHTIQQPLMSENGASVETPGHCQLSCQSSARGVVVQEQALKTYWRFQQWKAIHWLKRVQHTNFCIDPYLEPWTTPHWTILCPTYHPSQHHWSPPHKHWLQLHSRKPTPMMIIC